MYPHLKDHWHSWPNRGACRHIPFRWVEHYLRWKAQRSDISPILSPFMPSSFIVVLEIFEYKTKDELLKIRDIKVDCRCRDLHTKQKKMVICVPNQWDRPQFCQPSLPHWFYEIVIGQEAASSYSYRLRCRFKKKSLYWKISVLSFGRVSTFWVGLELILWSQIIFLKHWIYYLTLLGLEISTEAIRMQNR